MATRVLDIYPQQTPFALGKDSAMFTLCGFNVLARTGYTTDEFAKVLAAVLVAANVGQYNVDIFVGDAAIPTNGNGPYLHIAETSGLAPIRVHDSTLPNQEQPGAQIVVRAKHDPERTPAGAWPAAKAMAQAAYVACFVVGNQNVTAVS